MKMFVRDLTVIDASRLSVQRGMVGESWLVDVELSGGLNEMSMLLDFGQVKKRLKAIIDAEVDHKLLVPALCSKTQVQSVADDIHQVDFLSDVGSIHLQAPSQAFCFIPAERISLETVTRYLHERIRCQLPENIEGLSIKLRSELISGPRYHYSHGLKKHDGNCQRIAHGHRSMIEIWVDGERNEALEIAWATRWADIYLGSEEDRVPLDQLKLSATGLAALTEQHLGFAYTAPQGEFYLAMPAACCDIIDTDTTVELLADYILRQLQPKTAGHPLKIVAYEGVGKGAIAER